MGAADLGSCPFVCKPQAKHEHLHHPQDCFPGKQGPFWSQTRRNATGKWSPELLGVEGPQTAGKSPPTRPQCYKNGLVVGGLEANGLDEDPVTKGLVEVPAGWLSCLWPNLAGPKSLKEEPFCC